MALISLGMQLRGVLGFAHAQHGHDQPHPLSAVNSYYTVLPPFTAVISTVTDGGVI